jgi:hypothetical protein
MSLGIFKIKFHVPCLQVSERETLNLHRYRNIENEGGIKGYFTPSAVCLSYFFFSYKLTSGKLLSKVLSTTRQKILWGPGSLDKKRREKEVAIWCLVNMTSSSPFLSNEPDPDNIFCRVVQFWSLNCYDILRFLILPVLMSVHYLAIPRGITIPRVVSSTGYSLLNYTTPQMDSLSMSR